MPSENFNPRPPCGGRQASVRYYRTWSFISIHAPRAGGDFEDLQGCYTAEISIHAPRAGGDVSEDAPVVEKKISIHAPRAGGDRPGKDITEQEYISIHAPRAGGDVDNMVEKGLKFEFQSTPPVRGATVDADNERLWTLISIHAPRAGGDLRICFLTSATIRFQSTPPVRGATQVQGSKSEKSRDFNPRPPCGGRHLEPSIANNCS